MALILEQSFEGTGYDHSESWTEFNGAGNTLDEDNAGPGSLPPNGGSQCLRLVKAASQTNYIRRDLGSARSLIYPRWYVRFASLSGLPSGEGSNLILGFSSTTDINGNGAGGFGVQNNSGTYRFRFAQRNASVWQYVYGPNISLDTWYCLEGKWDNSGSGSHEFLVDGTSQGTLTGNYATDRGPPRYFSVGSTGTYVERYEMFIDMLKIDDADWVGLEEEPAPPTRPRFYYHQQEGILAA